jgi:uncharacterized phage protein gp47/JayE
MTASITTNGVQLETLGEAVAAFEAEFLGAFPPVGDQALDLSADSYTGREIQILAEQFIALQDLLTQFVDVLDPTEATGTWVDFHLALQATRRKAATRSTIAGIVYGLPGAVVGDKRVRFLPNESLWRTPVGLIIGPTGVTPTTLTADTAGPVSAINSGTASWTIVDVTAGWVAVESSANVNLGTSTESDEAGRLRAQRTASGVGWGTLPALYKALLEVPGVVDVGINNNRGLLPNSDGVPGKSVECVVEGGTDEDVAYAIASTVNGTAGFFGGETVTVTLSIELVDGTTAQLDVEVKFTRVAYIDVIAQYTIAFGVLGNAPSNASDLAKTVAANYINGAGRGVDVVPTASGSVVTAEMPANSEPVVTALVARKGDPLAGATIAVSTRQRARINPEVQAASIEGTTFGPFNFNVTWVLSLEVDGIAYLVSFTSADFAVVSAAEVLEIANVINAQVPTVVASSNDGALLIETLTLGATATLGIALGTSALLMVELGLALGSVNGSDGDIEVVIV